MSSLTAVLKMNGVYTSQDSKLAYLPLTSSNENCAGVIERKIAEMVAKCISKENKVMIVVSGKGDLYQGLVFSTDINLAGRGDASAITRALKAAQKLFENSVFF